MFPTSHLAAVPRSQVRQQVGRDFRPGFEARRLHQRAPLWAVGSRARAVQLIAGHVGDLVAERLS